jgi:hypothetical protein
MDGYTYLLNQFGSRVRETTIEIPIPNASGTYYLPDDSILREKTIVACYYQDTQTRSAFTTSALANKGVQRSSYLTLVSGTVNLTQRSPLPAFQITDTTKELKMLYLDSFSPSKSYITAAPADVTPGEVFQLTFIYLD